MTAEARGEIDENSSPSIEQCPVITDVLKLILFVSFSGSVHYPP